MFLENEQFKFGFFFHVSLNGNPSIQIKNETNECPFQDNEKWQTLQGYFKILSLLYLTLIVYIVS